MAQSGYTPIVLFHSTTSGSQPTTGNLAVGELALNVPDGKIYYNTGSTIAVLAGTSGYSGFSGYSGTGYSGPSGYSGYSGYSGFSGASASLNITDFTATSGQTVFTLNYTPTLVEGVYRNGIKLGQADYTATNGTSITLATGAITGDLIEVVYFSNAAVTGTSGYSGYSGYSGATGSNGASGFSGYSGSGVSGYSGFSGTSGYSGSAAAASIPSGSVLLFYQSAAPTGWTQVTTLNDYALRLVSGTGGSTGGTTAFSSVFTNQTPTINVSGLSAGATTLSTAQIPSHQHNLTMGKINCGYGSAYLSGANCYGQVCWTLNNSTGSNKTSTSNINNTGGGGSHSHSISGSASSSSITLNVQYANVILCSKN